MRAMYYTIMSQFRYDVTAQKTGIIEIAYMVGGLVTTNEDPSNNKTTTNGSTMTIDFDLVRTKQTMRRNIF